MQLFHTQYTHEQILLVRIKQQLLMCVFFYQRENPLLMHVSTQSNKKKNLVSSGRQQLRAHFASAYMNSGKKK
jgi:hypothetical protein